MARWHLVVAVAGAPPGHPYREFPPGTKIADSAANAHPGDVVWPFLASHPNPGMKPLDADANTINEGWKRTLKGGDGISWGFWPRYEA